VLAEYRFLVVCDVLFIEFFGGRFKAKPDYYKQIINNLENDTTQRYTALLPLPMFTNLAKPEVRQRALHCG